MKPLHSPVIQRRSVQLFAHAACMLLFFGWFLVNASASHAFAAGATSLHTLAVDPPTCSGVGCDGTNPYATFCAGQSWDQWRVLASTPVKADDGGSAIIGYVQLWRSTTCATNWARLVIQAPHAWSWVTVVLQNGTTTAIDPDTSGASALLSPQLYAPTVQACAHGTVAVFATKEKRFDGSVGQSNLVRC